LRKISRIAGRSVSNHADGRASAVCTRTLFSSRSWKATTHCGSPKPLGLVALDATSGCGTCIPSAWSVPDMVLVPLRPDPTTKAIRRPLSLVGLPPSVVELIPTVVELIPSVVEPVETTAGPLSGLVGMAASLRPGLIGLETRRPGDT
jgi:hypothetical protein